MPILTLPFTSLSKKWGYSGDQKCSLVKLNISTILKHNLYITICLKTGADPKLRKLLPTFIKEKKKDHARTLAWQVWYLNPKKECWY